MIPLTQIIVEERQREDLGDIQEQADSMKEYGQLQPIVVEQRDDSYILRAGGRRLTAAALLNWTEIDAVVRGEMTETEAQLIELEENIRRKQLEWKEEVHAVERIHQLKVKTIPNWTAEQTAALIGRSRRTVFNALELSKAVRSIPDVANADKPLAAMNRLKRHKQMEDRKEQVMLRRVAQDRGILPTMAWFVHQGDCVPYLREMADGCMDMILTDPPWAVNYDDLLFGTQKSFDDDPDRVLPTVRNAIKECYRVLRVDRFCIMYWPSNSTPIKSELLKELGAPTNITLHELGRWFLTSAGFKVWPRPCIWYKPNKNFGSMTDPTRQINSQYETFFWAFKGEARFFKRPQGDVFVADAPGAERLHPNEKNVELSEMLIDICTVSGENVLDPFCGGGSHLEAALLMERNAHGVELDREFADRSATRAESISQRKVSGELPPLEQPTTADAGLPPPINNAKIAPSSEEQFDQHLFDEATP